MDKFMQIAFEEAQLSIEENCVPIGACLVFNHEVIGRGHNQILQKNAVTAHVEMVCLENAGLLSKNIYNKSSLYTTLSPCSMCTGAILLYGIKKYYYR